MERRATHRGVLVLAAAVVAGSVACAPAPPEATPTTSPPATSTSTSTVATSTSMEPMPTPPTGESGEDQVLYHGGVILTMEDAQPEAEAVLVAGDSIIAVGTLAEVRTVTGPAAREVDLGGWTLLPGFIDSHSHRITQRFKWGFETELEATTAALAEGWTGIAELALTPEEYDALVEADRRGELLVRIDAYLAVNPFAGGDVDDWYTAYQPGQVLSPHLRIAGLKVFIDADSGRTLLWQPDELAAFVSDRHAEGWQVAMKAIGKRSHELALHALERALVNDSNERHRHRIEHSLAVDDDQLRRLAELGVVVAIQPGFPGVIWYDDDIRRLVAEEGVADMFRWPEYLAAGIPAAASPYNPDPRYPEFIDASYVSPMGVLYRSLTQTGLGDHPPEPWMLDRALTVEQLLPLLTIGGAYSTGVDDVRGSLAVGKLADLVVLDADPRSVPTESLLDVSVQMTMVGGAVHYLRPGAEHLVVRQPSDVPVPTDTVDVAADAHVSASSELATNPATNVLGGAPDHWNAAAVAPQWIEIRLDHPREVVRIALVVAQDPAGRSVHELWLGGVGRVPERVMVFDGVTADGDVLVYQPDQPVAGVDLVRVVTTSLGDLFPAWRAIEIFALPDERGGT